MKHYHIRWCSIDLHPFHHSVGTFEDLERFLNLVDALRCLQVFVVVAVPMLETCGGKMFEMRGRGWVWKFGLGLAVRGKIR
jgi:hypothetical protein